jgi:hypothetical protein
MKNGQFLGGKNIKLVSRVTGLGDFSPIGRLFALARFLKITKLALIFGLLFHS